MLYDTCGVYPLEWFMWEATMRAPKQRGGRRKGAGRPKSQTQTIARTFRLPVELDNRLQLLASELDVSISKLIRKILSDFL